MPVELLAPGSLPRRKPGMGYRLDPQHPLVSGLVGFWILNEGTSGPFNLDSPSTRGTLDANVSWTTSPLGLGLKNNNSDVGVNLGNDAQFQTAGAVTAEALYIPVAADTSGTWCDVFSKSDTAWTLEARGGVNNKPAFYIYNGAYKEADAATTSLTAGVPIHLVGTYDGANARIYVNGLQEGSIAATGNMTNIAGTNLYLLKNPDSAGQNTKGGTLIYARLWNRALNAQEIANLYQDPYDMVYVPQMVFIMGGAGGTLYNQTVSATSTTNAAILKQVNKPLAASGTSSAALTRQAGKILSATKGNGATVAKQAGKGLSASSVTTATLTQVRTVLQALSATISGAASLVRQVNKSISAGQGSSASQLKRAGKTVNATQASSASPVKQASKSLSATSVTTAALSSIKVILVSLSAGVGNAVSLVKQAQKALSAAQGNAASQLKQVSKPLSAGLATAATLAKQINKTLSSTLSTLADLVTRLLGLPPLFRATSTVTVAGQASATLDITQASTTLDITQASTTLTIIQASSTVDVATQATATVTQGTQAEASVTYYGN